MKIAHILQEFGLTDKEAAIYTGLLELEVAGVQEITAKTGLNRSSIYVVLEALQKKGLVSIASDQGVRKYVAAAPERLERLATEQLERQILLKQNLATLLPQLKAAYKGSQFKPKVRVLEGKEGLKQAFEITLNSKENVIRVASSVGNIFKSLPDYLPLYVHKRYQKNLRMLGIHSDDTAAREMVKHGRKNFDTATLIPKDKFRFPSDLGIYDNNVAFMSTEQLFTVIIESKEISDIMKTMFDLALEEAKRLQKKLKTAKNK